MRDADTSIVNVKTLFIHEFQGNHSILTPNPQGHPLPVSPQPLLRRATYVPVLGDIEQNIQSATAALHDKGIILAFLSEDSAGAMVTSRILSFQRDQASNNC